MLRDRDLEAVRPLRSTAGDRHMSKGRLETFADAILAIIMTIMVLELATPRGTDLSALALVFPKLLTYALSFVFLGIYWVNHHHLFQAVERVNGAVLWANIHLLFWLSLVPFVTAWAGDNAKAPLPVATYGAVLLIAAIAYLIVVRCLLAIHPKDSPLATAIGRDTKGKVSVLLYVLAIPMCFLTTAFGWALYVVVALIWLVPDRRIETILAP
jgi:uncharacterized membrane protein